MREILLATKNPGKAREMREILDAACQVDGERIRWRNLSEFPDWPEPEETGETFLANAELKASYYAGRSGMWTIADDSGLEVDALGGEPGVRSARFAGEQKDDLANNRLVIERLRGVPAERRTARFRCAVALSDGHRVLASAEAAVEGRVIDEPLGHNGFGYDPHFRVDEFGLTTAQMSPEQKHRISHRGQALRKLKDALAVLVGM
jgi:XTP/dITP diphosphohydrolase